MCYVTVKDTEWTYPDRLDYASAGDKLILHSVRNSYAAGQVLLAGVPADAPVTVTVSGGISSFTLEKYELVAVMLEDNPHMTAENSTAFMPVRKAPYRLYDCAKPLGETLSPDSGTAGLYLAFVIPDDATPGTYTGVVTISVAGNAVEIPVSLTVYAATVPNVGKLKIINGFHRNFETYHGIANGSPEANRLEGEYLDLLRRARQNMMYVGGEAVTSRPDENGCGDYAFDFSALETNVKRYMAHGMEYFNMSSVGGRRSWHESTILVAGMPAMSYEAFRYLAAYLPALQKFLEEKGWIDRFYIGVSDEPNDANATEFRALCGIVRKLAPKLRLLDALSFTPVWGALDVWVPLNSEYERHKKEFDAMRLGGSEVWIYVCCGPRGYGYINRFMDYPLLSTRYLFWGNYKYNLTGYLHWAANCYQPGQNPFEQNCPEHRNADAVTILPPGDTHIIYPGKGAPWMSLRLEAQRASAEDYELFCAIAEHDKAKADEICAIGFRAFNDVEYDVNKFEQTRIALYRAASEIEL
jgi:hypothetical protein